MLSLSPLPRRRKTKLDFDCISLIAFVSTVLIVIRADLYCLLSMLLDDAADGAEDLWVRLLTLIQSESEDEGFARFAARDLDESSSVDLCLGVLLAEE